MFKTLKNITVKAIAELKKNAEDYKIYKKCKEIIEGSGVLDGLKSQIADFALVAVYQAEFAFNKIGIEKKKIAFRTLCNFIKYPIALKPFKRIIERFLYDFASEKIEESVQKLKEHLKKM